MEGVIPVSENINLPNYFNQTRRYFLLNLRGKTRLSKENVAFTFNKFSNLFLPKNKRELNYHFISNLLQVSKCWIENS